MAQGVILTLVQHTNLCWLVSLGTRETHLLVFPSNTRSNQFSEACTNQTIKKGIILRFSDRETNLHSVLGVRLY